jgi:hypothetical protein
MFDVVDDRDSDVAIAVIRDLKAVHGWRRSAPFHESRSPAAQPVWPGWR